MVLAMLMAGAAAASNAGACPIERATYRLNGAPAFTAGFARQDKRKSYASDLAFWLKTPKRTYWFSFSSPNGYGGTYISPDVDPKVSSAAAEPIDPPEPPEDSKEVYLEFDAFAADRSAFQTPPQSRDKAPAWLFARGLGPALNYNPVALAAGDSTAGVEYLPIGLFERAGCAPAGAARG